MSKCESCGVPFRNQLHKIQHWCAPTKAGPSQQQGLWKLYHHGFEYVVENEELGERLHVGSESTGKRAVECLNAMAGIENPKEHMFNCHYQLNQAVKELAKFSTLGEYRLGQINEVLAAFPKGAM